MYSTCLFCTGDLGTNEVIERFPVGRRLAFDAAKGRLWVVCRKCGRWNLTPLEERWEAIEACERHYRDTRLRAATDNIGLAKLREGLELVRIGEPLRPEFAAWRYGDQFGIRRRNSLLKVGAGAAVGVAALAGGISTGLISGVPILLIWGTRGIVTRQLQRRRVARLRLGDRVRTVRRQHLDETRFFHSPAEGGWVLEVGYEGGQERFARDAAVRVAGQLLPQVNAFGASGRQVDEAVRLIEAAGDPAAYFEHAARIASRAGITQLPHFPYEARLALEMAAHEDAERRALEGELAELERAWRDAEEIAAIADDLFLPASVTDQLGKLREK